MHPPSKHLRFFEYLSLSACIEYVQMFHVERRKYLYFETKAHTMATFNKENCFATEKVKFLNLIDVCS